ncbi:MAG: conjugal transfer protein [Clostridium sp.]|uniref:conjugal transfer protein n=1 Tax=Clostridium sp. TaxID=1506 RepID=UPI003F40BCD5
MEIIKKIKAFFNKKNKKEEKTKKKKIDLKRIIDKTINNKKVNKISAAAPKKAIRIALWVFIGFLMFRGAVTILRGSEAEKIDKQNTEFLNKLNADTGLENKAYSFAEAFTREYFTRVPDDLDDFKKRITKYTTEQLASDMNNSIRSEIISASAFSFEKYSKNQINVGVQAKIKVYTDSSESKDKNFKINLVTESIKVPIYIDDNKNMCVDALPVLIAAPKLSEEKVVMYQGESVSDTDITNKIQDSITQFFKAYYELDQTQIDYFIADGAEKIGGVANSNIKFKGVNEMDVYQLPNNKYLATVNLTVNQFETPFKQAFNVTLVKKGDKYLIDSINTRVTNLNIK